MNNTHPNALTCTDGQRLSSSIQIITCLIKIQNNEILHFQKSQKLNLPKNCQHVLIFKLKSLNDKAASI